MKKSTQPRWGNLYDGDKIEITYKGKRSVVKIVGSPYFDSELEQEMVETSKYFIRRVDFASLKPKRV